MQANKIATAGGGDGDDNGNFGFGNEDGGDDNVDFGDGDGARGHCKPTKIATGKKRGGIRKWEMVRL